MKNKGTSQDIRRCHLLKLYTNDPVLVTVRPISAINKSGCTLKSTDSAAISKVPN